MKQTEHEYEIEIKNSKALCGIVLGGGFLLFLASVLSKHRVNHLGQVFL